MSAKIQGCRGYGMSHSSMTFYSVSQKSIPQPSAMFLLVVNRVTKNYLGYCQTYSYTFTPILVYLSE